MNYTFIALAENKPGVLNRVASLFRRRNFNIESIAAGRTEDPNTSRITIVVDCPNGDIDAHRIEANLYKLVNVIDVQDVTHQPSVTPRSGFDQSARRTGTPRRGQRARRNLPCSYHRCGGGFSDHRDHRHGGQDRKHDRTAAADRNCRSGANGQDRDDAWSQ